MDTFTGRRRFTGSFKQALGALLAPAPDPRQLFEDASTRRRQLLTEVGATRNGLQTTRLRLSEQADRERALLVALENDARSAMAAGNADLARACLRRRLRVERGLATLDGEIASVDRELRRLSLLEERLRTQAEQIAAQERSLAAHVDATEARLRINDLAAGAADELATLTATLGQMHDQHQHLQARRAAIDELFENGLLGVEHDLTDELDYSCDDDDEDAVEAALNRLADQ